MTPFAESLVVGLVTGLVSGCITGYYSGAIISRRSRFDTLRSDALRHLNSIDYMQEDSVVQVSEGSFHQLLETASELFYFGHRVAGKSTMDAYQLVGESMRKARCGQISSTGLEESINEARVLVRSVRPSLKTYAPFGRM